MHHILKDPHYVSSIALYKVNFSVFSAWPSANPRGFKNSLFSLRSSENVIFQSNDKYSHLKSLNLRLKPTWFSLDGKGMSDCNLKSMIQLSGILYAWQKILKSSTNTSNLSTSPSIHPSITSYPVGVWSWSQLILGEKQVHPGQHQFITGQKQTTIQCRL